MTKREMVKNIQLLKKEKNALILAHYYQPLEIQNIADIVGDSFDLSVKAKNAKHKKIVFCGVFFMAETAKLLSPEKQVLIPDKNAICPMANMVSMQELEKLKVKYPDAAVVCYINTTAEVKAVSDVCVTSSSAINIINKMQEKRIIFIPDKNLGNYISENTNKEIISIEGFCYVHNHFVAKNIIKGINKYPGAKVLVHPECPPEVVNMADEVLGTSGMINYIENHDDSTYIIGTEQGLIERLQYSYPDKRFFSAGPPGICVNMKKINLIDVFSSLKNNKHLVHLSKDFMNKAAFCLRRMIELNN